MNYTIEAIYDAGVFRPVTPVQLEDGTPAVVEVELPLPAASDEVDGETRKAWRQFLDRMASMPDDAPQDGLTNRDHDRILYGG